MILFGGSGHAKVIKDAILASGGQVSFIFDDNPNLKALDNTPIVGSYDSEKNKNEEIIISIGDNMIRKKVAALVKHPLGKVVHPSSIISNYASVDLGTVVMPKVVVNAGTSIGKHCIINTGAIIEHDCELGDYVHISPNATLSGTVKVGEGTHIGSGATVIPNLSIGKWCIIGAGAVITKDVPDYSLVVGIPGSVIRSLVDKS